MPKMKVVNGKLVVVDDSPAPVTTDAKADAKADTEFADLDAQREADELPDIELPDTSSGPILHIIPEVKPGLPACLPSVRPEDPISLPKHILETELRREADRLNSEQAIVDAEIRGRAPERPTSAQGTPFDEAVKKELSPNTTAVYSPSIEDLREFFNLEVMEGGFGPDHPIMGQVLKHKFVKAVKDCSILEIHERIQMYDRLIFELRARRQGAVENIKVKISKLDRDERARQKSLDDTYNPKVVKENGDRLASKERQKADSERTKKSKVVSKATAIKSLMQLLGVGEDVIRKEYPQLFE